jgi:phosphate transport system substrate-binding protein
MSATGTDERQTCPAQAGPLAARLLAMALPVAVTVTLAGCGTGNIPQGHPPLPARQAPGGDTCVTGSLAAAGSSAQANAMARWRRLYQRNCPASISYEATGSGAGIQAFIDGKIDFAGTDTPLSDEEQRSADKRCGTGRAIHLPMVVGEIAIAYHVPGLFNLKLGPTSLAKIFTGSATTWNDAAIRTDNPGAVLPSSPIHSVHRSDSSGTTDNFTAYLAAAAANDWTFDHGKDWKAPGGTAVKGTSGVARAVSERAGSIGYVELSAAQNASLKVAGVNNGSGRPVQPTMDSAERTVRESKIRANEDDLRVDIDYTGRIPAAYPLVQVTYEVMCQKGLEPGKARLARSLLSYAASSVGQRELTALGYARLPDDLQARVASSIGAIG